MTPIINQKELQVILVIDIMNGIYKKTLIYLIRRILILRIIIMYLYITI